MAWMSELLSDNAEQRAFTAAAMNTFQVRNQRLHATDNADTMLSSIQW